MFVEKKANTLEEGIKNLMAGAKADYVRWSTSGGKELSGYSKEQVDNWDNKTVTYQEAKQEFDDFISKWAEFVDILSNPGPPSEFANLVTSHEEIKTLVNLVYEDTVELKAGLESSDTGERRSAALESFNSNLDQLTDKISEIVASASS